jgi:hypothetical protein
MLYLSILIASCVHVYLRLKFKLLSSHPSSSIHVFLPHTVLISVAYLAKIVALYIKIMYCV